MCLFNESLGLDSGTESLHIQVIRLGVEGGERRLYQFGIIFIVNNRTLD